MPQLIIGILVIVLALAALYWLAIALSWAGLFGLRLCELVFGSALGSGGEIGSWALTGGIVAFTVSLIVQGKHLRSNVVLGIGVTLLISTLIAGLALNAIPRTGDEPTPTHVYYIDQEAAPATTTAASAPVTTQPTQRTPPPTPTPPPPVDPPRVQSAMNTPSSGSCRTSSDCPGNQGCVAGKCRTNTLSNYRGSTTLRASRSSCQWRSDCPSTHLCIAGECQVDTASGWCESSRDCGSKGKCKKGRCHVDWWCLCYQSIEYGTRHPTTACRRGIDACNKLQTAVGKGSKDIVAGSVFRSCQNFPGTFPWDRLGRADQWEPSSKPGNYVVHRACVIP